MSRLFKKWRPFLAYIGIIVAVLVSISAYQHSINQTAKNAVQTAIALKKQNKIDLENRVANVYIWCNSINAGRNYSRVGRANTIKQDEANRTAFLKVLRQSNTLPTAEQNFVDNFIKLANKNSSIPTPYTLSNLNCKAIANKTISTSKNG